jgi:thiamine transport system substrate-binding protein
VRSATIAIAALLIAVAACGSDRNATGDAGAGPGDKVTLIAYDSFPVDDAADPGPIQTALDEFTADTGVQVELLIAGDTGTMVSKAVLTAGNPEGDVMWGIDNTFLSRAIEAGVFEPYLAAGLEAVPAELTALVPGAEVTPVDFGDVCVNYDIAALAAAGVAPPTSFADLIRPEYAGMLVVENPATSSPGLAFLLATIATYGDGGWEQYWAALRAGDVAVVDNWTQAYYERFTWAGGDRPLVVSYGSSPPFEMLFATEPLDTAPTGVVASTCFRQVEFAGVLRGTDAPAAARRLVDFLISERFQREIPLNLFVFPANRDVVLADEFVRYATIPTAPLALAPADIDAHRADWIDRWTAVVAG